MQFTFHSTAETRRQKQTEYFTVLLQEGIFVLLVLSKCFISVPVVDSHMAESFTAHIVYLCLNQSIVNIINDGPLNVTIG